ncbi:metallophosphoesterase family protein [Streptomyces roseoverticillatus]|uniref:purple acid phosphatase family protein n=1 Tax=Streptomyces roseoverticillatus TaxID=66429 RepID=UPI001F28319A|nr:metallophosphoesterase family protein [Streptomyces roseoverticillatus]MCF3105756.1 metallophosphoesterase family protein [Streptomyces roseoverticillatus]
MAITRRSVLKGSSAAAAVPFVSGATGEAAASPAPEAPASGPLLQSRPHRLGAPGVLGVHLQFGSDPSSEMTVSWITPQSVRRPQVRLGSPEGGHGGRAVEAETRTYRDGLSKEEVYVHHARITGLRPSTTYLYAAGHDGATPETGSFTTAPRGRAAFTFTSFGDQATPNLRRVIHLPDGVPSPVNRFPLHTSSQVGSPASADIVSAVERVAPLFNFVNGDLCYAAIAGAWGTSRVATWADWFINNSRSTRLRPWMPCAGNHENEKDNGPIGAAGYQTYFALPASSASSDEETRGMWYAFTVGAVRFISLANDDVALQDGGDTYISGYSGGAQRRWLERELKAARADRGIDWIVVCMHQPMISSHRSAGSDLGVRRAWGPLFDAYGVDLVVSGHEHHYERSHPVRGTLPNEARTPVPVSTRTDLVDTGKGTVHMVIGAGGNIATSQDDLFDTPQARVLVGLKDDKTSSGHREPVWIPEEAPWAAVQDRKYNRGFAAFDVDPGDRREGLTRMRVTYYTFDGPHGDLTPVDTFTLQRPRSDVRH